MKKIVVLGGRGFFGAAIVRRLREEGLLPLVAARRPGPGVDLALDADDATSLRSVLHQGDLVLDAAGPFQTRTTALVDAGIKTGFDVIDISDSLDHALRILPLEDRIASAGIRVLNGCSTASAISAAAIRLSGIADPVRLTGCLAPATRSTANAGSARSLLASIGRPVRVWRGGALVEAVGWGERREFVLPVPPGRVQARLFETADALLLPRSWPGLRRADLYVATRGRVIDIALASAARWSAARRFVLGLLPVGLALARLTGRASGCLLYEVEGGDGALRSVAFVGTRRGHLIPLLPALMAARTIVRGEFGPTGLVPPDRQIDPQGLLQEMRRLGIEHISTAG